ncbi:MAG TPA: TetR/AcrR family transcriptional regulator [Acidimicrobiales bacterium]|nr:TetR/AcrR family transcriptional regulator [Acidimicrobiales bacterium]
MTSDSARREEILETAAALFASSGLRTSLREIADRCGILPGSLYHHFESKEAIIVELVRRYRDELDQVAKEAFDSLHEPDQRPVEDRVIELGQAIAACAVRHRAALLLTLYEPPTGAGDELVDLALQAPTAIDAAMAEILQAGRTAGELRSGIDLPLLAERICQSMLHVGVGVFHRSHAQQLPAQKCRVLLHGVAVKVPTKGALDRSPAMQAARAVIAGWDDREDDDRAAYLRAVARAEFGRRGFEATTMRDIARVSGMSTGTVYRLFGSKDDLLVDIMQAYSGNVAAGWDEVVASSASPLEQLDALMWLNINVLSRFSEEFMIQLAWLRQSPPSSVDLGLSFPRQLRQLQDLLAAGERARELRVEGGSLLSRTRSLYELILTPENVILHAGPWGAQALARDTVLRGAMVRR